MAGLKFEGDLSQINERQLEYIKRVLESRGFKESKVVVQPVGKAGDNYVANVKRISVEDGKGGTFKMVAKIAPQKEILRTLSKTEFLFRNEHIMYNEVLPKFTQLEKAADVPLRDRLKYAICYGSSDDAPNEVILLEDLNEGNFIMLNRMEPIDKDCIKSVLKNFALLHSLAFALKHKEPQVYEEYKNRLFDMWSTMQEEEQVMDYFKQMETGVSMMLESDFHKKVVSSSITASLLSYAKLAIPDKNSKHSVIQQGDAWTNNIMFKFDGENTLLESIMIDYQVSKVGNPTHDLLYLIFNCSDYETRKEHFYDWIEYYHSELDKALSNYGLKANYVYSKDQLDADLKRYAKLNLGQSVLMAAMLSAKTEEAAVLKEAMESTNLDEVLKNTPRASTDPETIKLIKKRVEGIVNNYHEFGLLNI